MIWRVLKKMGDICWGAWKQENQKIRRVLYRSEYFEVVAHSWSWGRIVPLPVKPHGHSNGDGQQHRCNADQNNGGSVGTTRTLLWLRLWLWRRIWLGLWVRAWLNASTIVRIIVSIALHTVHVHTIDAVGDLVGTRNTLSVLIDHIAILTILALKGIDSLFRLAVTTDITIGGTREADESLQIVAPIAVIAVGAVCALKTALFAGNTLIVGQIVQIITFITSIGGTYIAIFSAGLAYCVVYMEFCFVSVWIHLLRVGDV